MFVLISLQPLITLISLPVLLITLTSFLRVPRFSTVLYKLMLHQLSIIFFLFLSIPPLVTLTVAITGIRHPRQASPRGVKAGRETGRAGKKVNCVIHGSEEVNVAARRCKQSDHRQTPQPTAPHVHSPQTCHGDTC